MSFLVPGSSTEKQTQMIVRWRAALQAKAAEIDAKFASRPTFTAYDVKDEIDRAFTIASEFADVNNTLMQQIFGANKRQKEIEDIGIDLLELKGFFGAVASGTMARNGYPPMYVFDSSDEYWRKALDLQKAPITWLMQSKAFEEFRDLDAALTETVNVVSNIPSASIKWTFDQLMKSFGLPTWVVPVVGISALLGLGAWAYFSFLAPVGAGAKLLRLRKNPKRRRYIRRRRR